MKKIFALILVAVLLPFAGECRNLWAYLSYSAFDSPEGPYVETYLTVAGNSVKFIRQEDGKYMATVNVLMTFSQNSEIKAFKKYELNSPSVDDTAGINIHFLDQQRFQLPNGTYDLEIQLSDKNKEVKPQPYNMDVTVDFPSDKPSFSDIELLRSYKKAETEGVLTKSGYNVVPYVFAFYPEQETSLIFYCELYGMDKVVPAGQKFLLSYYLQTFESGVKLNDFARIHKEVAKPVFVVMTDFDISRLASGNYNLVVEARNQNNEVVASKTLYFQRSNPHMEITSADFMTLDVTNTFVQSITNLDSLKEFISCTYPIATGSEQLYIKEVPKSNSSLANLQQFFYGFWVSRSPSDPQKAWLAYKQQVRVAQYNFGTPTKKGYQTDRGRVYLEYGPPNIRAERYSEPSTYPYEIWQYYSTIGNQINRKFVFYSQDMVTSDFTLLHSDARGEIYNSRWKIDLQSRTYSTVDLGETQTINSWGDEAEMFWDIPN
jgi:GWxTD domain-containing protein